MSCPRPRRNPRFPLTRTTTSIITIMTATSKLLASLITIGTTTWTTASTNTRTRILRREYYTPLQYKSKNTSNTCLKQKLVCNSSKKEGLGVWVSWLAGSKTRCPIMLTFESSVSTLTPCFTLFDRVLWFVTIVTWLLQLWSKHNPSMARATCDMRQNRRAIKTRLLVQSGQFLQSVT